MRYRYCSILLSSILFLLSFLSLFLSCSKSVPVNDPSQTTQEEMTLKEASVDEDQTWRLTLALPPSSSILIDPHALNVTLDGSSTEGCVVFQNKQEISCTLNRLIQGFHDLKIYAGPNIKPFRRTVDIGPWDWKKAIIYFIVTDRFFDGDTTNNFDVDKKEKGFYHGGDFQGIIDKIGYLADLGVNAIWITPIVDNIDQPVQGAGFPDWAYHGYWAEDFTKVDRHLGSLEKLREMIDVAHRNGIKVILDVVVNHAGYGSSWANKPDWVRSSELGTCKDHFNVLTDCIAGLPDFKTENPVVAEFLRNVQIEWIERSGCDGFRIDTAKHVEHEFWKTFRREIKARYPDFFLLGEVYGGAAQDDYLLEFLSGDEMDACFDFGFSGGALSYFLGRMRSVALDHWLKGRDHFPEGILTSPYLDSHDVPGFLHRAGGKKEILRLSAALQMTVIGIPTIYYGDEIGRIGGEWPDNRSDMPWGTLQDQDLYDFYQRLIAARRKHPVLVDGKHEGLVMETDVYAFIRFDPAKGESVIVALNRSAQAIPVTIPLPQNVASITTWKEELTQSLVEQTQGRLSLELPPFGVAILGAMAK